MRICPYHVATRLASRLCHKQSGDRRWWIAMEETINILRRESNCPYLGLRNMFMSSPLLMRLSDHHQLSHITNDLSLVARIFSASVSIASVLLQGSPPSRVIGSAVCPTSPPAAVVPPVSTCSLVCVAAWKPPPSADLATVTSPRLASPRETPLPQHLAYISSSAIANRSRSCHSSTASAHSRYRLT